jgi:hypothetical protein
MFTSKHRQSSCKGLPENAAVELHVNAFDYSEITFPIELKSWTLGSGPDVWVKRLHDPSYGLTACDLNAPKERFEFLEQC